MKRASAASTPTMFPCPCKKAAPPAAPFYISAQMDATSYTFFRVLPGWVGDLHPTPNPRLVICLSGSLRFVGSDSESHTLQAGGMLMDVNTTGKGHVTEVISEIPAEGIIIRLD
jgi:hypothetical protein